MERKHCRIPKRLIHILEGELRLNDASSLVCMGLAVAAALTRTFSLLYAGGRLLGAAQHTRGLSPTSQLSPCGGVANGTMCSAGMRAWPLI
jgi:hypothetical protein